MKDAKDAKASRAKVKQATGERKAKEAAKPAPAPKKRVTPAAEKRRFTDAELVAAVKKFVASVDDPTRSGAVKAVRAAGLSAAGEKDQGRVRPGDHGGQEQGRHEGEDGRRQGSEAGSRVRHQPLTAGKRWPGPGSSPRPFDLRTRNCYFRTQGRCRIPSKPMGPVKVRLLLLLMLLAAGCQGPFGLGGPPSPQDIANKPGQSSMQDGHFKVTAVILNGATHTNGTGDGVLVLKGKVGLKLNIQVSSGLLNVGIDLIAIGGKEYERIGNGAWTVTSDSATPGNASHGTPTYVGESQIGNDKAWHIRSKQSGTTYDEWVRESDGYMLKYAWQSDTGSFTMDFDQFNIGADIAAPSEKEIAASQYQALADVTNPLISSADDALTADANANDLAAYKTDLGRAISAEQQFHDGLAKITFPADMQADVQALVTADQGLIAVFQTEIQATSWTQISFDAETKAGNAVHAAVVKLRADLGLPPPTS